MSEGRIFFPTYLSGAITTGMKSAPRRQAMVEGRGLAIYGYELLLAFLIQPGHGLEQANRIGMSRMSI
jgi:hypothetical protein